jgi:predicted RNA-binding Zn-ribbon protein involved in translation (DUF1610 family)
MANDAIESCSVVDQAQGTIDDAADFRVRWSGLKEQMFNRYDSVDVQINEDPVYSGVCPNCGSDNICDCLRQRYMSYTQQTSNGTEEVIERQTGIHCLECSERCIVIGTGNTRPDES